jgi:hypothetical protein
VSTPDSSLSDSHIVFFEIVRELTDKIEELGVSKAKLIPYSLFSDETSGPVIGKEKGRESRTFPN